MPRIARTFTQVAILAVAAMTYAGAQREYDPSAVRLSPPGASLDAVQRATADTREVARAALERARAAATQKEVEEMVADALTAFATAHGLVESVAPAATLEPPTAGSNEQPAGTTETPEGAEAPGKDDAPSTVAPAGIAPEALRQAVTAELGRRFGKDDAQLIARLVPVIVSALTESADEAGYAIPTKEKLDSLVATAAKINGFGVRLTQAEDRVSALEGLTRSWFVWLLVLSVVLVLVGVWGFLHHHKQTAEERTASRTGGPALAFPRRGRNGRAAPVPATQLPPPPQRV